VVDGELRQPAIMEWERNMLRRLTVTDMARNFSEYINRVAYRGERFLLTRGSRVVAEIRPVPESRPLRELPELLVRYRASNPGMPRPSAATSRRPGASSERPAEGTYGRPDRCVRPHRV
jgi:antitoxin (DNA-binding transcriptional repressor) of toxin-antitoxin stability system